MHAQATRPPARPNGYGKDDRHVTKQASPGPGPGPGLDPAPGPGAHRLGGGDGTSWENAYVYDENNKNDIVDTSYTVDNGANLN